ncbi:MAG TPA: NAD-dependent protein deacylase [Veillonellaceae bacterium]|jgi:NAD-dependent deacetylase|nr:NAD-dependent protein deacylase [Veillonellaceae bacterium]
MAHQENLALLIQTHKKIIFFGGAGVSTESDIPDFRGPGGLYRQQAEGPWSPEETLSHHFYEEHQGIFFRLYREREGVMRNAQPNRAHRALAKLESMGRLSGIVTQNIDGLHQKAGSRCVWELHGSIAKNYCQSCGACYGLDEFLSLPGPIPHCPACGGVVKPDVVLYEEPLRHDVLQEAADAIAAADMMIIGGTSLAVYPAAGLIDFFKGDTLVLINQQPTPRDQRCTLVLRDSVGEVLERAVNYLIRN